MNQVQIIVLALIALGLVILGIAAQQALARMRKQKQEKVQQLQLRNRNLQSVLQIVPQELMSKTLKQFILSSMQANIDEALSLKPEQTQFWQDQTLELQELQKAPANQSKIDSVEKANTIRHGLKSLQQEVKLSHKDKRLDNKQGKDLLVEVELKMLMAAGHFYRLMAERSFQATDYKNAYAACQKLLDTYQKSKHKDQLQTEILKAKGLLKNIHNAWLGERQEKDKADAEVLASRMLEWEKDQDSWKKSQLYDD